MKVNRVNHYVAEVTDYNYNDRAITDLFSEYKFICIRNENPVTQNQLVQLGEMFGKVYSHEWPLPLQSDAKMWVDGERKIFRISNALDKDKIELGGLGQQHAHWHCDASHMEDDFHGTILYNHYNGHLTKTILFPYFPHLFVLFGLCNIKSNFGPSWPTGLDVGILQGHLSASGRHLGAILAQVANRPLVNGSIF